MRSCRLANGAPAHMLPARMKIATASSLLIFLGAIVCSTRSFAKDISPASPSTVKQEVQQIAVGKRVKVNMPDGKKVHGRLSHIGDDSFSVRTSRKGAETQIRYDEVTQVKDPPGPITWFLVGAAVVIIVILIVR